jgi:hypothetical protein
MLGYGLNVPYAIGVIMEDLIHGGLPESEAATKALHAVISGFSPIQGGDYIDALTPTQFKTPFQITRNINYAGGPIYPSDMFGKSPDSEKYFNSASSLSIAFSKQLNEITGGTRLQEGTGSISPESIDHIIEFYGGGPYRTTRSTVEWALGDREFSKTSIGKLFQIGPNEWKANSEVYKLLEKSKTKKLTEKEIARFEKFIKMAQDDDQLFEDEVEKLKKDLEKNQEPFTWEKESQDMVGQMKKDIRKFNTDSFTEKDIEDFIELVDEIYSRGLITKGSYRRKVNKINTAYDRLEQLND